MLKIFGTVLAAVGVNKATAPAVYTTSACAQFGQPEFQVSISDEPIPDVDIQHFLKSLEGMVAAGSRFSPGQTLQVGWSALRVVAGDEGLLRLHEPDMKAFPIRYVNSVDATLRQLRAQKDAVESVLPAASLTFPSMTESAVVHVNYKKSRVLVMQRARPEGHDSGWWVSEPGAEADSASMSRISLYRLALDRPDLIQFFAFPPDTVVLVADRVGVAKDRVELPIKPGSYLDHLNRRARTK
ncbi:immunity protein Imm33 domain-containing protein [Ottowia oryzae]|uniref:Imm33-like domain-containing protein n=1 Tax=Ottowia oryzae TaxID=2109914 RepID=A0A2S0MGI2_9BURK|nr:hypothetical protein [Ottowia oryzae]AVO35004.1 hypothetical protein C6570_12725 [Ottowia oryzae]